MAISLPPVKTLRTSVETICVGDHLQVNDTWQLITQISYPTVADPNCVIRTDMGIVEITGRAMVTIAG